MRRLEDKRVRNGKGRRSEVGGREGTEDRGRRAERDREVGDPQFTPMK